MRIGILEILASKATSWWDFAEGLLVSKQYANLTAQAVSVWCRQMGHEVFYATYYGIGDPKATLPNDLDIIFISSFSYTAPMAYALAKAFRVEGCITVLGGPHAKAFPVDSLRYFDIVVLECNRDLIAAILRKAFKPPCIVTSPEPYREVPSVEERFPEIRYSAFIQKRWPHPGTFIPMLASMGCPYRCDFCVDWNNPYHSLSSSRFEADLHYLAEYLPGVNLTIQDPNFAVHFDKTLSMFETLPPEKRSPYAVESSLTVLRSDRLARLRDTNCISMVPGIESWSNYSNKAGVGSAIFEQKLDQVVDHFYMLREYIPYLGANFIFGFDGDTGEQPFELTKLFIRRLPFVGVSLNTPVPFGGTPFYDVLLDNERVLETMPFSFYTLPYLLIQPKNYGPLTYYQHFVALYEFHTSTEMTELRRKTSNHWLLQIAHAIRNFMSKQRLAGFKQILYHLKTDREFFDFHTGKNERLPDFYRQSYHRKMGKYYELVPIEESAPRHIPSKDILPTIL